MIRGYYTAASGMFTGQRSVNTAAHNLSNATTAGYRSQTSVQAAAGGGSVFRIEEGRPPRAIGPSSLIAVQAETHIAPEQGNLQHTGQSMDIAILGEGFFVVETEAHGDVLSRNGRMGRDADGMLYIPGLGHMLDEGGRKIEVAGIDFVVADDGTIYEDQKEVAKLYIASPGTDGVLEAAGEGAYRSTSALRRVDAPRYQTVQGSYEASNVDVTVELTRLIASQNHFQSCAQILRIYDRLNEIAANQIGTAG